MTATLGQPVEDPTQQLVLVEVATRGGRRARPALPGWMARGACLTRDDLPWTTDTRDLHPTIHDVLVAAMADTCAGCPVLRSCRAYARDARVTGGFWAGHDRALTTHQTGDTP